MRARARDVYDPALYALIHRGTPGDAQFYASACRGASSVLELGCGYGRLIAALTPFGGRYRGLDLDPGLLTLARRARRVLPVDTRARVTLGLGDMRSFRFAQRFERIAIPHAALYCLRNDAEVLRCFRRVHEQLTDEGELVLDTYCADGFHAALSPEDMSGRERDWLTQLEIAGVRYEVFERTRWQKSAQRLRVTYDYEGSDGTLRRGVIRHRYLLRPQLEMLLARAELEVIQLSGTFNGDKLTKRSEQLVLRARRSR